MPFVDPDNPAWTNALARLPHDFYHLPGYVALSGRWEDSRPTAFVYEAKGEVALIPLLVRQIGDGLADAASPYGYPSPLFSGCEAFQREALTAFAEAGRGAGLVSSFLRLHPILQPSLPEGSGAAGEAWAVFEHGPTVALDLSEPHDAWLRRLSRNHCRNLRKLDRTGYTVRFSEPDDFVDYACVYAETMNRLEAAEHYRFTPAYFCELAGVLGDRLLFASVVSPDGETAAAGIFTCTGPIAQAHLCVSATNHLRAAPSKLLFVATRGEAARRGAQLLHLGGGHQARRDSLLQFKQGFAGQEHTFASARFVHRPDVYERLARERLHLAPAQALPESDFFPHYRQPTS